MSPSGEFVPEGLFVCSRRPDHLCCVSTGASLGVGDAHPKGNAYHFLKGQDARGNEDDCPVSSLYLTDLVHAGQLKKKDKNDEIRKSGKSKGAFNEKTT